MAESQAIVRWLTEQTSLPKKRQDPRFAAQVLAISTQADVAQPAICPRSVAASIWFVIRIVITNA